MHRPWGTGRPKGLSLCFTPGEVARAMFQSWRFKLREAEEALRRGQLDEARQRLERDGLTEYLPGQAAGFEAQRAVGPTGSPASCQRRPIGRLAGRGLGSATRRGNAVADRPAAAPHRVCCRFDRTSVGVRRRVCSAWRDRCPGEASVQRRPCPAASPDCPAFEIDDAPSAARQVRRSGGSAARSYFTPARV